MAGKRDFIGEIKARVKRSALSVENATTDRGLLRLKAILAVWKRQYTSVSS
jgi:hypothetical protein